MPSIEKTATLEAPPPRINRDESRSDSNWKELDLLRGWAAFLMIANHIAVHCPAVETSSFVGWMAFLGSMAPVMFFTITGLGYGVQSEARRPRSWSQVLPKIGILLVADSLMWLWPGRVIGLDFLGFIALSMLLLEFVRGRRHSGKLAILLCVLDFSVRFVLGPLWKSKMGEPGTGLGFWLGVTSLTGFSYSPSPWLVYPLLGYATGRLAARQRPWLTQNPTRAMMAILSWAVVMGAPAAYIFAKGGVLFRYGTMSIAFFLLSLAFLGLSLAASLLLGRASILDRFTLSGIRSLAIVPIHYLYRDLLDVIAPPIGSAPAYLLATAAGVVLSFMASDWVRRGCDRLRTTPRRDRLILVIWLAVACCVCVAATGKSVLFPVWSLRWTGQILLCLLLGANLPSRRPAPDPAAT
ncbi:heparan-alpha-glucosaminide N-acetyltransferase domain-containing protein [Aquisphaera insulae]|uniref:heparan-alpha-glucosaminide N-acetyltransferase domain-containing protein n=1 Tax=Aquisphaera insulae TaxID=2712864 RepID=UPI0013ECEB11|nr:heparan-alpha-glucosaminide N-acetyltransferase domain-containing protein [Aquisphaera insulae]